MPYDWIFEVEQIIIRLVPAYTLETLDKCDIERLLPFYFFDYRKALKRSEEASEENDNIKLRNGKKYRVVKADEASWIDDIF